MTDNTKTSVPDKIDQTEFGAYGNCRSACIAMLLGMDLKDVPNFEIGRDGKTLAQFQYDLRGWFWDKGYDFWSNDVWNGWEKFVHSDHYFMGIIQSDLGPEFQHCVIMKGDKLFHNPLPNSKMGELVEISYILSLSPHISKGIEI